MMISKICDFSNWKEDFAKYLAGKGYKPSVVKDYPRRIEKIINDEGITIQELSANIDQWIAEYKTGKYMNVNKAKHYAPSSALMKFKDFYSTLYRTYTENQTEIFCRITGAKPGDIIF